jgi:anti-sigma regulatory factor (Ser/Thr protein kinase)
VARHRDDLEEAPGVMAPPGPAPIKRRTIRGRLVRILALPLGAVVILLAVVVVSNANAYQNADRTDKAVRLLVESDNLIQDLQQERGITSGLLAGDVSFRTELRSIRTQVDAEAAKLAGLAVGPGAATVGNALAALDDLATVRTRIDTKKVSRNDAFAYFTARIATLTGLDLSVEQSSDLTLRYGVDTLQALNQMEESIAQERAFLAGVFAAGGFKSTEYQTFAQIHAAGQVALARFEQTATEEQFALVSAALNSGAAGEAAFFEARAFAAAGKAFVVSPQSWWSANTTLLDDLSAAQQSIGRDVSQRAASLKSTATVRLGALGVLAVLAVLGAAALLSTASRSITRPLAMLAAEAYAIANVRLPEAIRQTQTAARDVTPEPPPRVAVPRRSSAEIAAVAMALDGAQETAYALATEQARLLRSTSESLANLGRRNQNLLRRQLGFITELEREETDPGGLANLFELDHLATRMRRNAESLLVLVGEHKPRTWSEPVPVSDVLRAAISEVEDYRRVTLRRLDDAYVGGAFVAGVAHVIAELVENGLSFSPPDVDVEIQGRLVHGRYVIGVTDQGIGMEKPDMERSNARLRGEESFLTAPTRFLGHYVVGQLAKQLGIDVELSPSPVTGVTARVTLSAPVLTVGQPRLPENRALAISAAPPQVYAEADTEAARTGEVLQEEMDVVAPGGHVWFDKRAGEQPANTERNSDRPAAASGRASVPMSSLIGVPTAGQPVNAGQPANSSLTVNTAGLPITSSRGSFAMDVAHGRGERTRNGLMKRVPGPRRPLAAEQVTPSAPEPPPLSSAQVRDTLNAFRAGIARGANDYAATTPEPHKPYLGEAETERSTHVY